MNINRATYCFNGIERIQWNRFTTDAERLAYIRFAKAYRVVHCNRPWDGIKLMQLWRTLPLHERQRWIDGHIWHDESEDDAEPYVVVVSEDEPEEEEQAKDAGRSAENDAHLNPDLQYRFVRTLQNDDDEAVRTSVRLYIGIDQNGIARDRIVMKVNKTDDEIRFNDMRDACALIDTLPDSGAILRNRFWTSSAREGGEKRDGEYGFEIRSYTEWCHHGTLADMIRLYGSAHWQQDPDDQIPEPMLWIVLKSIAEAIYNMETGLAYVDGVADNATAPDWTPKVHRDIKPENIFLREPRDPHSSFPHPVLADVDEILELSRGDEMLQKYMAFTAGYAAPENNPDLQDQAPDANGMGYFEKEALSTKTDIWALGVVLWDLMHSFFGRIEMSNFCEDDISNTINPDEDFSRLDTSTLQMRTTEIDEPSFTKDIVSFFDMCNQSLPRERPTAVALRSLIERKIRRAEKCLGSFEGDVEERMEVRLREDEFRIGRGLVLRRREAEEWQ